MIVDGTTQVPGGQSTGPRRETALCQSADFVAEPAGALEQVACPAEFTFSVLVSAV